MPLKQAVCFNGEKSKCSITKKSRQTRMLGVWRLAEAHKLKMQEDATGPVVGYVNRTTLTGLWKVQSREGERLQSSIKHHTSRKKEILLWILSAYK